MFFPKHVAKYLGLEGDSVATKIATAAWAVLAPVLTYVLALHKATIDAALTDWTRGLVERVFGS